MDTKNYQNMVSAKEAARRLGVVPDYVTRICRDNPALAERRGRVWFVDFGALEIYREQQLAKKESWHQELSLRRKHEYENLQETDVCPISTSTSKQDSLVIDSSSDDTFLARLLSKARSFERRVLRMSFVGGVAGLMAVSFLFVLTGLQSGAHLQGVFSIETGNVEDASFFDVQQPLLIGGDARVASVFDGFNSFFGSAAEFVYDTISGFVTREIQQDAPEPDAQTDILADTSSENTNQVETIVPLQQPPILPESTNTGVAQREIVVDADTQHLRNVSVAGTLSGSSGLNISGSGIFSGSLQAGQATFSSVSSGPVSVTGDATVSGGMTSGGLFTADGGITTNGADINAGAGSIFASNILSSITAGRNVRIDESDPQNPVISVRDMSSSVTIPDVGEVLTGTGGQFAYYESDGRTLTAINDILFQEGDVYVGTSTSEASLYLANGFFQDDLPDCNAADDALQYDASTGKFVCGDDAGATAGVVDVYDDGAVAAAGIRSINFTDHFIVSGLSAVAGAADVAIDYAGSGITREGEDQTITGEWNFSTGTTTVALADVGELRVGDFFQSGLGDCSGEDKTVLYSATTGKFYCGLDAQGSDSAVSTIKEGNVNVVLPALSMDFAANDFTVTSSLGGTQADIAIDYASSTITRGSEDETIAGAWTFSDTLTARLLNITEGNATSTLRNVSISRMLFAGDYISDLTGDGLVVTNGSLHLSDGVPNKVGTVEDQILSWDVTAGEWILSSIGDVGGGLSLFTELQDTPGAYIARAIPFAATSTDELLFDAGFTFDPDTDELRVAGGIVVDTVDTSGGATSTFAGIETTGMLADYASTTVLRLAEFYQQGLSTCNDESQTLLYNATSGTFSCGSDAGSDGAVGFLERNNAQVLSGALRMDFSGDFAVSVDSVDTTEGDIAIDYGTSGITRNNQDEVITGSWQFTDTLDVFALNATSTTATSTFAGNIQVDGIASTTVLYTDSFFQTGFTDACNGQSDKVIYNSMTGKFECGFDGGSVTAQAVWATSSNNAYIYPADPNDIVVIGNNATSTTDSMLEVSGKITATEIETTATATLAIADITTATIASFFQSGLGDCSLENQVVLYDAATGKFTCGGDESGSGTAVSAIKEGGVGVVSPALSMDFAADDFVVTSALSGTQADVAIDYSSSGITRSSQDETISGSWSFEQLLTAPYFTATSTTATSTFPRAHITALLLGASEYVTSLTGAGLQLAGSTLSLENTVPNVAGTADGELLWWDTGLSAWATTSTSTLGITLETIDGVLAISKGGTGITTTPAANEVLIGDGAGGYTLSTIGGLGVGNGTFLGLDDTPASYIANAVPFASSTAGELLFSNAFTFNADTARLTVAGSVYADTLHGTNGTSTFTGLQADVASTTVLYVDQFFQTAMPNCSADDETLLYDAVTGQFTCGTDSGAEGGVVTIREDNGANASIGGALAIDFLGADFIVTEDTVNNEGDIAIDYTNSGIARKQENETVTGSWDFTNTLDVSLLNVTDTAGTSTLQNVSVAALQLNGDVVTDIAGSGLQVTNGALSVADSVPNVSGSAVDDILLWDGSRWATSTLAAAGSVTEFTQLTDTLDDFTGLENGILFIDAVGNKVAAEATFMYDATRDVMAIGTSTVSGSEMLTLFGTQNGLRLAYDAANYVTMRSDSMGVLEIDSTSPNTETVLEVGDGSSMDALIRFFGDMQTYYFGQDDTDNALKIGQGQEMGTSTFLTITEVGNVGIGTVSNDKVLAVAGDVLFDSSVIDFASSSASVLTLNYATEANNIIIDGASNAWSIGTTSVSDILAIDTSGTSTLVSIFGGFSVNNGSLLYDVDEDRTIIDRLQIGSAQFAANTGGNTWMDVPVDVGAADGTKISYSAKLDSNPFFTLWSKASSGGVSNRIAIVGDLLSDAELGNGNIPDGSLIITDGILCVDKEGFRKCSDDLSGSPRNAGTIYAYTTTLAGVDVAEEYPTKDETLEAGEVVMLSQVDPVFVGRYTASAAKTPAPFGVVSTEPGVLLGGFGKEERFADEVHVPVALAGRVPVKVSDEGGDIAVGDRLAVSPTLPGVATKLNGSGYSIGIALEEYIATSTEVGSVLVFIDTQYIFADNQLYIDSATGNVGIGTTTPQYTLHVAGDVGAESFVNISTRGAKRDIATPEDERKIVLLGDLYGMSPVEYHYNSEDKNNPLRLGFIAEDAPDAILSVDEKGVDLYKLSALTVLGVQDVNKRLETVEAFLGLSVDDIAGDETEETETGLLALVLEALQKIGVSLSEGLASFVGLTTEELTVGSSEVPTGIQLYDEATGEPYCVYVRHGVLREAKGFCGDALLPKDTDTESEEGGGAESAPVEESVDDTAAEEGVIEIGDDAVAENTAPAEDIAEEVVQEDGVDGAADAVENATEEQVDVPEETPTVETPSEKTVPEEVVQDVEVETTTETAPIESAPATPAPVTSEEV